MASLREDYWETFQLKEQDIEFLYNYLLETETPLNTQELLEVLVADRIQREKAAIEQQRSTGCDIYFPRESYSKGQKLVFPDLDWRKGEVIKIRPGVNPDLFEFDVIQVKLDTGELREYAARLVDHALNHPPEVEVGDATLNQEVVLDQYQEELIGKLEEGLSSNPDFVRIAGKWFPRALLVDINVGHLNLAEAVLDVASGGPLPTTAVLQQVEVDSNVNQKLLEFSMDYALQEDPRFDEVGASGEVLWFLQRLEPEPVREPPPVLSYSGIEFDHSRLTEQMLGLEGELDDELTSSIGKLSTEGDMDVCLIFPHWRVGTLPLSERTRHLFPTAYEAPRIRFTIVDGESNERFPAWVVRPHRYVYGLKDWYVKKGLLPGSIIKLQRGKNRGEVILKSDSRHHSREWVRTVLVGSDGGVVFAMLRQPISSAYDERMTIAVPDVEAIDQVWERMQKERVPFERIVVDIMRELAKLNPQSHVHASELYAAVNVVRRCPPGPILELLASRPWFVHVGDLHFRYNDTENT